MPVAGWWLDIDGDLEKELPAGVTSADALVLCKAPLEWRLERTSPEAPFTLNNADKYFSGWFLAASPTTESGTPPKPVLSRDDATRWQFAVP